MPAQRAKGNRYATHFTKLNQRTWASINRHDDTMRQRQQKAWDKLSASLPDNCFADDVQDNDYGVYYPKSFLQGRNMNNG
jgi:hypothetical protein